MPVVASCSSQSKSARNRREAVETSRGREDEIKVCREACQRNYIRAACWSKTGRNTFPKYQALHYNNLVLKISNEICINLSDGDMIYVKVKQLGNRIGNYVSILETVFKAIREKQMLKRWKKSNAIAAVMKLSNELDVVEVMWSNIHYTIKTILTMCTSWPSILTCSYKLSLSIP